MEIPPGRFRNHLRSTLKGANEQMSSLNHQFDANKMYRELNGIYGWLLFFIINIFWWSISLIIHAFITSGQIAHEFDAIRGSINYWYLAFRTLFLLAAGVAAGICGVLLSLKKKYAVSFIIKFIIIKLIAEIIHVYAHYYILNSYWYVNTPAILDSIYIIVINMAYYLYFKRSKRVAITYGFIKPPRHDDGNGDDDIRPDDDLGRYRDPLMDYLKK